MQLIKPFALALTSRCFEFRKRRRMSVAAMVYFPFPGDGPATVWTEMGMWKFLASQMATPVIDEGMVKTRSEYLVHGHAYAPGGSSEACAVRARVGSLEKTLLVFGNRYWDGDRATDPAPFARVPLDWQHAYGGPDFPANPLGRGRAQQTIGEATIQRLPNIESPRQRLTRPSTVAEPAGFGIVDLTWPQRAQYRGTYDESWLEKHAPGLAPDTDWRFFNLAPADQIFDQAPRGDESFEFENLHPDKPVITGRLPGLRPRVYCRKRLVNGTLRLSEVQMQLTTLWFFPHAERGVMIFHGQTEILEPDGSDVLLMLGALERLDEPKGDEHYLQVLDQRLDPAKGFLYALRDSDLLPAGLTGSDPEFEETKSDYKLEGLMGEAQARRAELQVLLARDKAQEMGLDPDKLGIKMPVREKPPTIEELPDYIEKKMEMALIEQKKTAAQTAQQILDAEKAAAEAGFDLAQSAQRGPPTYSAAAHIAALQADLAGAATPPTLDLATIAPKLREAETAARFNYLMGAHLQPPALPMPTTTANTLRRQMVQARADGVIFESGNFTGADLSGLDLSHTNFRNAWLEGANLSGARLDGADFSHAVLAHANLADATALGTKFHAANLGKARVAGAVFDGANLYTAILSGIDFTETAFRDAELNGTNLQDCKYGPSDWSGSNNPAALFLKAKLGGMIFCNANLEGATFVECDLTGADFRGARLGGASFVGCKGPNVTFAQADLSRVVFVQGCVLDGADFSAAGLRHANLRGATLIGANFSAADLRSADLSECVLDGANLSNANLADAMLIKALLPNADARGSNWMNVMASRSDIRGVDFTGSNLFSADLTLVDVDTSTRFSKSFTVGTQTHPRRPVEPQA